MSRDTLDTHRVVTLLLRDAVPTLGERSRAEALRLAAQYEGLAREWMAIGDSLTDAQRAFDRAVVDGLQQSAHDLFWDTSWPPCPRHPQHPLWYDDDREAWRCHTDTLVLVPLGELAGGSTT